LAISRDVKNPQDSTIFPYYPLGKHVFFENALRSSTVRVAQWKPIFEDFGDPSNSFY